MRLLSHELAGLVSYLLMEQENEGDGLVDTTKASGVWVVWLDASDPPRLEADGERGGARGPRRDGATEPELDQAREVNAYVLLNLIEHVESGKADYKLELSLTMHLPGDEDEGHKVVYIDGNPVFQGYERGDVRRRRDDPHAAEVLQGSEQAEMSDEGKAKAIRRCELIMRLLNDVEPPMTWADGNLAWTFQLLMEPYVGDDGVLYGSVLVNGVKHAVSIDELERLFGAT